MFYKRLLRLSLAIFTAILIVFINSDLGLAQFQNPTEYLNNSFSWQKFQSNTLNIFTPDSVTTESIPVVVDGREIFDVGQTDNARAEDRAKMIENRLKNAIKSEQAPQITVREEGRLAVLYLNGEYLFTVTSKDTIGEERPLQRASYLKRAIAEAIEQGQKERSSGYLQRQVAIALGLLFFALIGSRLLEQLQRYPLRQAIQKIIPGFSSHRSSQPSNLTTLIRVKLGFVQLALWVLTILVILELFPYSRDWRYGILNWIVLHVDRPLLKFGGSNFSLINLLFIIGLLVALIIVSNYITDLLRTKILQVTRMNRGSQEVILTVTKYGLIFLGTLILLQSNGIDLSSIAFFGSILGVGIGFGLQDIARNFASGLVLLFERSVQVGDYIQVGSHEGTVEIVRARSIVLKTLDRISIIVPNSRLLTDEVINWSHHNSVSRLHLPLGVAYGCDVNKVKTVLLKVADEHLEVLRNPKPQVFLKEFGDSSINFELLIWIADPSRQMPIKSELYFAIEAMFREQEVEIPFPQRDLHIRTGNLPLSLSPQIEGHLLYLLKGLIAKQYNDGKK
ncbi:MAG: mechanosensitive ion channel family protein [Pleurocapsa sp.]